MGWIKQILRIRKCLKGLDIYDIVLVYWDDIASDSSWLSSEARDKMTVYKCCSVGFLTHKNNCRIKISSSYIFSDDSGSAEIIPIGCITDIVYLGRAE